MAAGMVIAPSNKRTIRSVPNPLDKATIVSICPLEIHDVKHTIQPGIFHINPGSEANPTLATFGPSSWWHDIGEDMPLIEIPNGAIQIAESIINDFCNGLLMCDMNESMPGYFFVPGELTIEQIKAQYSGAMKNAIKKQRTWFTNLIKLGDVGWAVTNGNPNAISGLMRMAAEAMGQMDKPWMASVVVLDKIPCVACGNLRNPAFPICPSCNRIVDLALAKKLNIVDLTTTK